MINHFLLLFFSRGDKIPLDQIMRFILSAQILY